jgi:hypothetical protein
MYLCIAGMIFWRNNQCGKGRHILYAIIMQISPGKNLHIYSSNNPVMTRTFIRSKNIPPYLHWFCLKYMYIQCKKITATKAR